MDMIEKKAAEFARLTLDAQKAGKKIVVWCDKTGELGVFLSMKKHADGPRSFPKALVVFGQEKGKAKKIATFALTRPDYKPNEWGVGGNHIIQAVLGQVKGAIEGKTVQPARVFTSQTEWGIYCAGPEYSALKEERAIDTDLQNSGTVNPAPTEEPGKLRI